MFFAKRQFSIRQEPKAGSVTRWRLRGIAYLIAAVLFIAVTGYLVTAMRTQAGDLTMKLVDRNGTFVVECTGSVTGTQAEDPDPDKTKFKVKITSATCTGGGVASAEGDGFVSYPSTESCAQANGNWTGTVKWKDSNGNMIGISNMSGNAAMVTTGGSTAVTLTGSVAAGDTFGGSLVASVGTLIGPGLTCLVVGEFTGGGDFSGSGSVAP